MPGRILLISTNTYEFPYAVYPLGAAYVANAVRHAGHCVRLVDLRVHEQPLDRVLREFAPDVIGLSIRNIDDVLSQKRENLYGDLRGLTRFLRRHSSAPIVLGGSGYSIFPGELLALAEADFGIRGEGERSLVALIEALNGTRDFASVPGLVWRSGTGVQMNPAFVDAAWPDTAGPDRPPDLAEFYLRRSSMLNVQTQRGCSLTCCYCTYPLIEGRPHRRRNPDAVADELAGLERRGVRYVFVVDAVFNSSADHVAGVCEAILRRGVRLQWGCFLRPARLTAELLRLMARAGLSHVEFGSDSFSDRVLASYGKQFTFEEIARANAAARGAGVECCHFLICGGPGETEETLAESFDNSQRLEVATIMARAGMRVYPGTPLFERLKREGALGERCDLLRPAYYVAPPLTEAGVSATLRRFGARAANWLVEDPPASYLRIADRLRARGVVGPLWNQFAMLRRLDGAFAPAAGPENAGPAAVARP